LSFGGSQIEARLVKPEVPVKSGELAGHAGDLAALWDHDDVETTPAADVVLERY
jgi:hypothetical protein